MIFDAFFFDSLMIIYRMIRLMLFTKSMKQYCMQGNGNFCLSVTDNRSYSLCGNYLLLSVYKYIVYGRFC